MKLKSKYQKIYFFVTLIGSKRLDVILFGLFILSLFMVFYNVSIGNETFSFEKLLIFFNFYTDFYQDFRALDIFCYPI